MNQHVPEDLLLAFVEADVDEQLAIHIATHLDACPHCATRAAHLEPLAAAFAAVDDPPVPDDLVEAILAASRAPRWRLPTLELGVGAVLMVAATVLVFVGTDPVALAFDALDAIQALPRLGQLAGQISVSVVGLALALALFVAGSGFAIRRARSAS